MQVLYGLVDVSICRKCRESTTAILYPIGSKIPRPNISFADGNRSVYKRLGVTTKCVPNCHFLRSGWRLGSIGEQTQEHGKAAVSEPKRQKNPHATQRKFPTSDPKIPYFGTPVALLSSLNEDGSTDLRPISSFWALRWTLILGLLTETKTADHLAR
jgi:hypothetical protein